MQIRKIGRKVRKGKVATRQRRVGEEGTSIKGKGMSFGGQKHKLPLGETRRGGSGYNCSHWAGRITAGIGTSTACPPRGRVSHDQPGGEWPFGFAPAGCAGANHNARSMVISRRPGPGRPVSSERARPTRHRGLTLTSLAGGPLLYPWPLVGPPFEPLLTGPMGIECPPSRSHPARHSPFHARRCGKDGNSRSGGREHRNTHTCVPGWIERRTGKHAMWASYNVELRNFLPQSSKNTARLAFCK